MGSSGAKGVEDEPLRGLDRRISLLLQTLGSTPPAKADWAKLLCGRKTGYGGEVVGKAQRLTLAQILPGLPPEDLGASVDAHGLARGRIQEALGNPDSILKNQVDCPSTTARSAIIANKAEGVKTATELWKRGILCKS